MTLSFQEKCDALAQAYYVYIESKGKRVTWAHLQKMHAEIMEVKP